METTEKKQTAKEAIAENVRHLMEQLQAGKSDALSAYLETMGRFHAYSFGNVLAIARQKPNATRVAGFHTWKGLNRSVRKGEKGIRILAPMIGKRKETETTSAAGTGDTPVVYGFRNVYVFDVTQTDGADLPAISCKVGGDVGENLDHLRAFVASQGITLEYSDTIPALGLSYGGRIVIQAGQSPAEEFTTLVHETAHELLHKVATRAGTCKAVKELEAESVAFVVGKGIGLEMGSTSADYIHLYNGNAGMLAESLEAIRNASKAILDALETTSARDVEVAA